MMECSAFMLPLYFNGSEIFLSLGGDKPLSSNLKWNAFCNIFNLASVHSTAPRQLFCTLLISTALPSDFQSAAGSFNIFLLDPQLLQCMFLFLIYCLVQLIFFNYHHYLKQPWVCEKCYITIIPLTYFIYFCSDKISGFSSFHITDCFTPRLFTTHFIVNSGVTLPHKR